MPRHDGLPKSTLFKLNKSDLLHQLVIVDEDKEATARVLQMEVDFRKRISQHIQSLPTNEAQFSKFNTNPFVLMIHSLSKGYVSIGQIG
jgi:hypothetical protein